MRTLYFKSFSKKQLLALTWWNEKSNYRDKDAVILDGAIRSGKTLCMSLSFVMWSFYRFNNASFAICGKTIRSVKRNVITPIEETLNQLGFKTNLRLSENLLEISFGDNYNRFYLFGGKDESSSSLIQGMTLSGVLLDEVALMPRSFVEQAIARCSQEGSKFWFNCNPEHPGHWFYQEWILKRDIKNALYLHFTMNDNPSLSAKLKNRYENLYSGTFYKRFIQGEWVASQGIIYPFMSKKEAFHKVPQSDFETYIISCDYGTVNPSSFGLWGQLSGTWYRIQEYYFDSRKEGYQRTDEEHYTGLLELANKRKIKTVVIDPSAASFIALIRKHGKFTVKPAKNNVLDGIRQTSTALKSGEIKICETCLDSIREFSVYSWDESQGKEVPIKENDHAMDDIRYFVTTILRQEQSNNFFAFGIPRSGGTNFEKGVQNGIF